MNTKTPKISIVTPTFKRPKEVVDLLANIAKQSFAADEIILVDGTPEGEDKTHFAVKNDECKYPFEINYIRHGGGTAIQRNIGIDAACGDFIALIDDDVRLSEDFLKYVMEVFEKDRELRVGGVVGYRTNEYFDIDKSDRWRWYKRLKLLSIYEPGRYDFNTGYPINNNLQPPFTGTRSVDFMTTACAVWRRQVFESGLRFHTFFRDYGVLEDAHFSLKAGRSWDLLQSGDAVCEELHAPGGRIDRRKVGYKCVVNYYFVFQDIAGPLSTVRKFRFWRYQAFEFLRITASAIRRWNWEDVSDLRGRIDGIAHIVFSSSKASHHD